MSALPVQSWPSPERALELFARLRPDDTVGHADFAVAFLDPLAEHLRRNNTAHDHALFEAAEDAVISLLKNPAAFDPARGSLQSYLCMSAAGDLKNVLSRERRHHEKRASVELDDFAGKEEDEGEDLPSLDHPTFAAAIAEFTDPERAALELMRDGVRETARFAEVLGIAGRAPREQFAEVKRAKDRIKQRLKRVAEGL
jgi:DNA-directed RNA polymerase specialized sigma24 family protein